MFGYKEKCALLAKEKNVIVIGEVPAPFEEVLKLFSLQFRYTSGEDILERLDQLLVRHNAALLFLFPSQKSMQEVVKHMAHYYEEIGLVCVYKEKLPSMEELELFDVVMGEDVQTFRLYRKLFMVLNRSCFKSDDPQKGIVLFNDRFFDLYRRYEAGELTFLLMQQSQDSLMQLLDFLAQNYPRFTDNRSTIQEMVRVFEKLQKEDLRQIDLEVFDLIGAWFYHLGLYLKERFLLESEEEAKQEMQLMQEKIEKVKEKV